MRAHGFKKKLNSILYVIFFVFVYSSAYSETYTNTTVTVEAAGNTSLPVIISGDTLIFDNESTEIFGKGNVVVRHAENVIFADLVYINPDNGDVSAEGKVMAVFSNSRVYTEKLYYNTKTQDAYCKESDVISPPWIIRCESMTKQDDKTSLKKPVFTTCDDAQPHYRMQAEEINMYGTKKIEAWHIGVYLGLIPVLYFPYYSQSLEGNKDPFEFQLKHNDENGWYTNIKYYFFLTLFERFTTDGQLGFDYYEKKGPAFNSNLRYAFSEGSTGTLAGAFHQDKTTDLRRWWLNYGHSQVFTDKIRAGFSYNSSSDSKLEKDFLTEGQVDMFKHELAGSFTGTFFNNHTIGLDVKDTEQLNPATQQYYTYSRLLPKLSYTMTSAQIIPYLYYDHILNLSRSYQSTTYSASTDVVYTDVGSFAPNIKANTPKLGFATLSANAGLRSSWTKSNETDEGWGELLNFVNTSETLQLELIPGGHMLGTLSHSYAKQMNKIGSLAHEGITSNILNGSINGGIGTFTYSAGLTYDMLKDTSELFGEKEIDRFSLLNLNGTFRQDVYYMAVNSAVSLYSGQVRNTTVNFSVVDNSPKNLWSAGAVASFINNKIDGTGHPLTVTVQDDSLTFSTSFSFGFTPDFRVSMYRSYDLMQKTLVEHKYALTWYIHCWQADLSWSKRQDNAEEIFFSVAISAIPEFRVNKPSSAMPDQFKNMGDLIPQ